MIFYCTTYNITLSIQNGSAIKGGGIYTSQSSSPTLEDLTITNNFASDHGAGIACDSGASPTLLNVTISNNSSAEGGGGISLYNADITIEYSIISNIVELNNIF